MVTEWGFLCFEDPFLIEDEVEDEGDEYAEEPS